MQVICDLENEENDIPTDTCLLASTETETLSDRLCTYNMPLCSNNEGTVHGCSVEIKWNAGEFWKYKKVI